MERLPRPVPFGKYELLEKVASGGMAEVFRACTRGEAGFEKFLAIKRILPHLSRDTEFVVMLIDEAKIAVTLNHANVVQIYDLGKADGTYFIAMEFVEGADLKAALLQSMQQGSPLPPAVAVFIAMEVLKGLEYAHHKKVISKEHTVDMKIIHRDISPPNVLISYEGEVKIVDFGIAKANTRMMETSAGVLKGKFEYMSPEQAAGLQLDCRTDLFSAGLCLYESMTGVNPFAAESDLQVIQKVRATQFTPASRLNKAVPPRLDHIIRRALAQDLEERYQTATEFRSDLAHAAYETGLIATSPKLAAYMRGLFGNELATGRPFVSGASLEASLQQNNLANKGKRPQGGVRRPPKQAPRKGGRVPQNVSKKPSRSHTVIQPLEEMETAYVKPEQGRHRHIPATRSPGSQELSPDSTVLSSNRPGLQDMSADATFLSPSSRAPGRRPSPPASVSEEEGTDALSTLQGMSPPQGKHQHLEIEDDDDDENGPPTLTEMNPRVAQDAFATFIGSGAVEAERHQRTEQAAVPPKSSARVDKRQQNKAGPGSRGPSRRPTTPRPVQPSVPPPAPVASNARTERPATAPATVQMPTPPAHNTVPVFAEPNTPPSAPYTDLGEPAANLGQTAQLQTQAAPKTRSRIPSLALGAAAGLAVGIGLGMFIFTSDATSEVESDAQGALPELIIRSNSGAVTFVNGRNAGSTYPLNLALPLGQSHDIRVTMAGYEAIEEQVQLSAGETRFLVVSFEKASAEGLE